MFILKTLMIQNILYKKLKQASENSLSVLIYIYKPKIEVNFYFLYSCSKLNLTTCLLSADLFQLLTYVLFFHHDLSLLLMYFINRI